VGVPRQFRRLDDSALLSALEAIDQRQPDRRVFRADYANALSAIKTIGQQLFGAFVTVVDTDISPL